MRYRRFLHNPTSELLDFPLLKTPAEVTVTQVAVTLIGTGTVTGRVTNAMAAPVVFSSGRTVLATFDTPTVAANTWLSWDTTATSDSVSLLIIDITYSVASA